MTLHGGKWLNPDELPGLWATTGFGAATALLEDGKTAYGLILTFATVGHGTNGPGEMTMIVAVEDFPKFLTSLGRGGLEVIAELDARVKAKGKRD